jgi:uncharacterized protein (DUF924 family)
MDKQLLDDVYSFWFGADLSSTHINPERIRWWMIQNDDTDHQVRSKFGHVIAEAAQQDLDLSVLSRQQAVALVVLFDQFPRNLYRTSGEAFAYDHLARCIATRLTADGWDCFTAMERFILGLPYVHHEDPAAQDFAVMIVSEICVKAPADTREAHRFDLDQAIRHREVIRRFGRFPHRNAMLGRPSTPEEVEFLKTALRGRGF